MTKIALRYQQVRDAKKFWEILNNPEFTFFPVKPKTIKEERDFLRKNRDKRTKNVEHNFAITLHGEVVGAIGIAIDQRRPHIGEIGYFIERKHWGKGIASHGVKLIEDFNEKTLGLYRIEIVIMKKNKMSMRVAEKCGYYKEGVQQGKLYVHGEYVDAYLYSKVIKKNP